MEVREDRVGNVAQRHRVCRLRRPCVVAYTQDLGIFLLEQRIRPAEQGDLVRSTACEREYVEGKYDVLLPPVIAERYLCRVLRWKRKIRRLLSNICHFLLLVRDSEYCEARDQLFLRLSPPTKVRLASGAGLV